MIRAFIFSVFLLILHISYGQETPVTVDASASSVGQVFASIEQQTDYHFAYNSDIQNIKIPPKHFEQVPLKHVLNHVSHSANLEFYQRKNSTSIAVRKQQIPIHTLQKTMTYQLQGQIIDDQTEAPIEDVFVRIQGRNFVESTYSKANGAFVIQKIPKGSYRVEIARIGYSSDTITDYSVHKETDENLHIQLSPEIEMLEAVYATAERKPQSSLDEPIETISLFSNEGITHTSGYGFVDIGLISIATSGGGGGVLLNRTWGLGGFGQSAALSGRYTGEDVQGNIKENLKLHLGYGGLYMEYFRNLPRPVHFSLPLKIGIGGASLSDSGNIENTTVFVVEPGINLNLNIRKWFVLSLGGSYRIVPAGGLKYVSNKELSGVNMYLRLNFGKF